jgi:hypothetical protein
MQIWRWGLPLNLATLMLSSSSDVTADMLTPYFRGSVLRIDLDRLPQSDFVLHSEGFRIDGSEHAVSDFTAVYWRKPSNPIFEVEHVDQLQEFEYLQRLYALRALSRLSQTHGIWHLVDPLHELHFPKPLQLTVAKKFFDIPPWGVFFGASRPSWRPVVTKAMSPSPVKDGRYLATKRIPDASLLSPSYTWFLQQEIDALYDATVVFCCGEMWAFLLTRNLGDSTVDWRLVSENHLTEKWQRVDVPADVSHKLTRYMQELEMHYARIDFLIDREARWWFLESNFNGQFGWLDPDNTCGMLSYVCECAEQRRGGG